MLVYGGQRGYGQVVARNATNIAVDVARAGRCRSRASQQLPCRRICAYGEQCAGKGMVSVHFVNATGHQPRVAPLLRPGCAITDQSVLCRDPASIVHPSFLIWRRAGSRRAKSASRNSGSRRRGRRSTAMASRPPNLPSCSIPPGVASFGEHKASRSVLYEPLGGVGRRSDDPAGQ